MLIGDVAKAIEALSASDRAALLQKLSAAKLDDLKAAADNSRLARLNACAQDEKYAVAFKTALRGLRRLGLDIEKIAAAGDTTALDKAMTEQRWSIEERIQLKTVLANIGGIS
jgi:hypothetical protein